LVTLGRLLLLSIALSLWGLLCLLLTFACVHWLRGLLLVLVLRVGLEKLLVEVIFVLLGGAIVFFHFLVLDKDTLFRCLIRLDGLELWRQNLRLQAAAKTRLLEGLPTQHLVGIPPMLAPRRKPQGLTRAFMLGLLSFETCIDPPPSPRSLPTRVALTKSLRKR
jgi:hypothetical protein